MFISLDGELEMEDKITTICYQCKDNKAVSGPVFPFCSEECKKKWGDEHYGKGFAGKKVYTIEQIQEKVRSWAKSVPVKNINGPEAIE